jgi:predicted RNase H-like nuclease
LDTFIGIDGFRGGWVAVYIDDAGASRFGHSSNLDDLLSVPYSRAMIDMPIGLPNRGYRQCDVEARGLVGSRVFLGARWGLWKFNRHKDANDHYWQAGDKGTSMQLWCIRSKLRDVNELMSPARQTKLRETHPELVFWRLAGQALDSKKSEAGRKQRIELLENQGFGEIDRWLGMRAGTGIGRDDLIDACACVLAARDSKDRLPRYGTIPTDARGLRMEIWY